MRVYVCVCIYACVYTCVGACVCTYVVRAYFVMRDFGGFWRISDFILDEKLVWL